jgi:predicted DNA-binding transcriptional regulator AlpA
MHGASLREISIPRFAFRRDEAAASLAISPALFDNWVKDGRMPKGKKIGGVVLWDVEQVRSAWLRLTDEPADYDGDNPFDRIVA